MADYVTNFAAQLAMFLFTFAIFYGIIVRPCLDFFSASATRRENKKTTAILKQQERECADLKLRNKEIERILLVDQNISLEKLVQGKDLVENEQQDDKVAEEVYSEQTLTPAVSMVQEQAETPYANEAGQDDLGSYMQLDSDDQIH